MRFFRALKDIALISVLILATSFAVVAYFFWVKSNFPQLSEAAEFGESFGGLAALFAALAFGGVVYALILQRRELSSQHESLQETRREMERSLAVQARQAGLSCIAAKITAVVAILENYKEHAEWIKKQPGFNEHPERAQHVNDMIYQRQLQLEQLLDQLAEDDRTRIEPRTSPPAV